MERRTELLRLVAQALDEGSDPFHVNWLEANRVTLDECLMFARTMALLIRGFFNSPSTTRQMVVFAGAADGTPIAQPHYMELALSLIELDSAVGNLQPAFATQFVDTLTNESAGTSMQAR